MIFNADSQTDFFAKSILLSIVVSSILSFYFLGSILRSYGAIYFLLFSFTWILIFLILNEILLRKCFVQRVSSSRKAVLITGCDRGFGFGFAQRLANAGFKVFAGCLDPFRGDAVQLAAHPRILCIKMDVTNPEEVQLALDYVLMHLQENELWAVVNNAGISKGSDIGTTSMRKVQEVLEVNLVGTIRVTKTFLPLLQAAKGRVVNIASAAGRLTLPGFVPYSVSKSAVIAFSEGLRLEMKNCGVAVVSIEPWIYRTKLSDISGISRQIERDWQSCSSSAKTSLDENHVEVVKEAAKGLFNWGVSSNLDEVIDVVHDAVTLRHPLYRYSPGKWYLNYTMWFLNFVPKPVADSVFCYFIFRR